MALTVLGVRFCHVCHRPIPKHSSLCLRCGAKHKGPKSSTTGATAGEAPLLMRFLAWAQIVTNFYG